MTTVGNYEVLRHSSLPECSLRLIRVSPGHAVERHYHQATVQIYVLLEGEAQVSIGDTVRTLRPYESVRVPRFIPHSITSEGTAVALSVSIPPLKLEDQHPVR